MASHGVATGDNESTSISIDARKSHQPGRDTADVSAQFSRLLEPWCSGKGCTSRWAAADTGSGNDLPAAMFTRSRALIINLCGGQKLLDDWTFPFDFSGPFFSGEGRHENKGNSLYLESNLARQRIEEFTIATKQIIYNDEFII